ncbi:MAG: type II toxin-antitoxin system RelB/DinJ family antitoxin [Clostridiales bacterium]|jgi:DNA-damage-inducible protein J|nr:type II toxin-antitoxin system RelB/DinJ family antitoxin [Clostridiales bacterium]
MAKSADLYIHIDPETKSGAEQFFAVFGITITDAVKMFLRQSFLVGGLPFEVKQPRYNAETEAAMQEARNIARGKIKAQIYKNVAEMNADIDAETDEV